MKIMSVFILIILLLNILSVMSDVQCDCSKLTFIEQLLQQEMFERKLADNLLLSELHKFSTGPESVESSSIKGSDISTRVDKLEQLVAMLKNTSDVGQQEDSANHERREENLLFQTEVKKALEKEKLERMNFTSHVQKQMEQFSDFKETFEVTVQERLMKISNDLETFEDNMEKLEQNSLQNINNSRDTLIKTNVNELFDSMTDFREDLTKSSTAVGSLKSEVNKSGTNVRSSEEFVSEVTSQSEEHQKSADIFTVVTNKKRHGSKGNKGKCGKNWKRRGNKCYRFIKRTKNWFSALERCRELNAILVEIESKKENDYVTDHMNELGVHSFWIGLNDQVNECAWKWNSAESTLRAEDFRNWAPSEPNNKEDEDCGSIYSKPELRLHELRGQWNDLPCSSFQREFVCQKSPEL